MYSKSIKNKKPLKIFIESVNDAEKICKVSKASTEIMLDRFTDGNKIDFPFSNN